MRLLCIAAAGNAIGFGHLNRCLSIAAAAAADGVDAQLFVFDDGTAGTRLAASGFRYTTAPLAPGPAVEATPALIEAAGAADAVVADIVHSWFFEGPGQVAALETLGQAAPLVAAIDAQGPQSLGARCPGLAVDMLVLPCALGADEERQAARVGRRQLLGAEFAILPPDFAAPPERRVRSDAGRVLITCGGADPKGWTPVVLDCLAAIDGPLEVRAAAGPLFSAEVRAATARVAALSPHRVEILDAPSSLHPHMLWADLAIAASGLTKYELAATGTPTVLFAIDAIQAASNPAFAAAGPAIDLGTAPAPERIAEETARLLHDRPGRQAMATAGQRLVDGRGARRLIDALRLGRP